MTMGYSSSYLPPFDNATGYLEYVENQLPELNHFFTVSSDTAIVAKDRVLTKFRTLKSKAKEAVTASKRQVHDAMLGPELNELTADEEEDVHRRLTDAHTRAESHFERCDADLKRIMGYHVNEAREEAQRKAAAAAEEARSRDEQRKNGSTSNVDGGEDSASKETKPANGQESEGKQDQGRGGKKKGGDGGKTGGKGDAKAGVDSANGKEAEGPQGEGRGGMKKGGDGGKSGGKEDKKARVDPANGRKAEGKQGKGRGGKKKGGDGGKSGGKGDGTAGVNSANGQEAEGKQGNGFDGSTAPKGCLDFVLGNRLHNGRWNVKQPGYGTVMKVNMGVDQKEVESHDVLMDDAESIVTMVARYVEVDVKYARTHVASGKGSPAGERRRSDNELVSPENSSKEEEDTQIPVATNNGGTCTGEGVDRSRKNGQDDKLCGTRGMVSVKKEGGQSRKNGDKGKKKGNSDDEESDSSTDVEMGSDKKGGQRSKAGVGGRYKDTGDDEESDSSTDAEIQSDNKGRQGSKAGAGGRSRGKSDDEGSDSGSDGGNDSGREYSEGSGDGSDSDNSDASQEMRERRAKQRKRNRRR
ncbi:hypothetical protein Esi_0352_0025 [Ectocarpus siliculosus]|uniref:Uncharacterized protein n=1 Tax=Ectocarpus siliculosus TaxID=2880 RepID=D7FZ27_ECTSI|nr:hypothetical protein Esi_0352_0025 [Ectocarpus siliculosus]|eukprot:CBJ32644.1 hypothetical protein Esi_0352_0025 [Ectocarpus siliculosus]